MSEFESNAARIRSTFGLPESATEEELEAAIAKSDAARRGE